MVAANAPARRLAFGEMLVANAARVIGEYDEARGRALAGLRLFETLGDRYYVGYAQLLCGVTELSAGNVEGARAFLLESLRAYEACGAKADAALALSNLGECAYALGEIDLAETIAHESAQRCLESGNHYFLAFANHGLARVLATRRDWSGSIRILLVVARSAREFRDPELVALCAELAADIVRSAGRYTTAAILLGAADAERERAGATRLKIYDSDYARLSDSIVAKLGAGAAEHARTIGIALASSDLLGRVEMALREAARIITTGERPRTHVHPTSRRSTATTR